MGSSVGKGNGSEKNEYRKIPEPIEATPEAVAKAIMQAPPKKDWRFQKKR